MYIYQTKNTDKPSYLYIILLYIWPHEFSGYYDSKVDSFPTSKDSDHTPQKPGWGCHGVLLGTFRISKGKRTHRVCGGAK